MMYWLLNSAVITVGGDGTYSYKTISKDDTIRWLQSTKFISRIGYPATANFLQSISGVSIPVNRDISMMNKGDETLIARLTYRIDNPALKKDYQPKPEDYDFATLRRLT